MRTNLVSSASSRGGEPGRLSEGRGDHFQAADLLQPAASAQSFTLPKMVETNGNILDLRDAALLRRRVLEEAHSAAADHFGPHFGVHRGDGGVRVQRREDLLGGQERPSKCALKLFGVRGVHLQKPHSVAEGEDEGVGQPLADCAQGAAEQVSLQAEQLEHSPEEQRDLDGASEELASAAIRSAEIRGGLR